MEIDFTGIAKEPPFYDTFDCCQARGLIFWMTELMHPKLYFLSSNATILYIFGFSFHQRLSHIYYELFHLRICFSMNILWCSGFIPEPLLFTAFIGIVVPSNPLSQAFTLDLPTLSQIFEGRSPIWYRLTANDCVSVPLPCIVRLVVTTQVCWLVARLRFCTFWQEK